MFLNDKKIYDPVHGFIRFDGFERELIDSPPFQRLRGIHQLGASYLVYPGATHTRFEHSLGVMELASRMLSKLCKTVRADLVTAVPRRGSLDYHYWQKILRLAALCHDLGHLPFSHVAEDVFFGKLGHEQMTLKLIESPLLEEFWQRLAQHPIFRPETTQRNIMEDIAKVALGEEKFRLLKPLYKGKFSSWEKILSKIISGDFFGTDRIDYLLRDSKCTGIVYGLFDYQQLIETLRILPSLEEKGELDLGIEENGLESCEALLLARYFMHRRVYQYSSIKAYHFHLSRFIRSFFEGGFFQDIQQFLDVSDEDVILALRHAAKDETRKGYFDALVMLTRKNRFKAIPLPSGVTEEVLRDFQKEQGISSEKIGWEFQENLSSKEELSFPVVRKHLSIEKAKDCSNFIFPVLSFSSHWVYVSPEFYEILVQYLKKKKSY